MCVTRQAACLAAAGLCGLMLALSGCQSLPDTPAASRTPEFASTTTRLPQILITPTPSSAPWAKQWTL